MQVWPRSLRWRLLGVTALTLVVALAGAGWSLARLFQEHAAAQFEAQLQVQLDQLTALFELDPQQAPNLKSPPSDPRWYKPYSGLYWQIERLDPPSREAGPARTPVLRSRSLWDYQLAVPGDGLGKDEIHRHQIAGPDGQSLRVLERRVQFITSSTEDHSDSPAEQSEPAPSWRLLVAADDAALAAAVARFTGLLTLFLAILGAALLAAAWVQVHLGLRPLRSLQAAVQAVRSGSAPRLNGRFPTEVEPLVQDFNRVLDQHQQVVERARHLAGNLAHAIKTPLAVMGNLANDSGIERPALARQLREQVAQVREQVDWHLSRARRSSSGLPGQATEVGPVIEGLVRVMRKVYAYREDKPDLVVETDVIDPALRFAGEAQDLQELVGNLLDNGCKWASRRVRVQAGLVGGELHITIDDDGPGLSPKQRRAVFERGVRADERTPGSGLGLAIARETAALYGGQVSLEPSELGGLRAELRLPAL